MNKTSALLLVLTLLLPHFSPFIIMEQKKSQMFNIQMQTFLEVMFKQQRWKMLLHAVMDICLQ